MTFVIRKATRSDVAAIQQIMNAVHKGVTQKDFFFADDNEFIRDHVELRGFILLAEVEGKTAGFLIIRFPGKDQDNLIHNIPAKMGISKDESDHVAHFESVAVLSEYRGMGIQKALMMEAMKYLEGTSHYYYMATVHPDNNASLNNLTSCGFQIIDTVKKYGGLIRYILFRAQ